MATGEFLKRLSTLVFIIKLLHKLVELFSCLVGALGFFVAVVVYLFVLVPNLDFPWQIVR